MGEAKPSASLSSGLLARKGGAKPAMRRPSFSFNQEDLENGQDDLGWNDMGYDVNPDPNAVDEMGNENLPNPLAAAVPEATPEVKKQQEQIAAQLQLSSEADYPTEAIGVPENGSKLSIGGVWGPEEEAPAPTEVESETDIEAEEQPQSEEAAEEIEAAADQDEIAAFDNIAKQAFEPVEPVEPVLEPAENLAPQAVHEFPLQIASAQPAVEEYPVKPAKQRAAPGSKAKSAFTLRLDRQRHLKLRLACAVSNKSAQKFVTEALDRMLDEMDEIEALANNISESK